MPLLTFFGVSETHGRRGDTRRVEIKGGRIIYTTVRVVDTENWHCFDEILFSFMRGFVLRVDRLLRLRESKFLILTCLM